MNDALPLSLAPMMSGDPSIAMETAKQIIGGQITVEHARLAEMASNDKNPKWTRIAAIYALGFLGDRALAPKIRKILADKETDPDIRGHAAEALGNIKDKASIKLLRDVLQNQPTAVLRVSCNYALSEMGT
jgi:HEAT repeat protein